MRRRGRNHIGRLRIRAANILARQFHDWDVRPEDICPATGRGRSDWRQDVYRWELFTRTKTGIPLVYGSWQTLTRFVSLASRYGCEISGQEIYAKESQ